ncbi:MAG TPA: D-aminoacyl-tRNA deacylase [Gemmatimonadales bacterium]
MKIVLQRVSRARVTVDGVEVGAIGVGYLVLLAMRSGDGEEEIQWMADKVVSLRLFPDEHQKMNRSLGDVGGAVLVVSQFTLYGDTRKGRRPSFIDAAPPHVAEPLYESFVDALRDRGIRTATGAFGAMMDVELVNDGPVTLVVER